MYDALTSFLVPSFVEFFAGYIVYFDGVAYIPATSFVEVWGEGLIFYTEMLVKIERFMNLSMIGSFLLIVFGFLIIKYFCRRKKNLNEKTSTYSSCNK